MLTALQNKGMKIEHIKIRASKTHSIQNNLQQLAFQDPEIKYLGRRVGRLCVHIFLYRLTSTPRRLYHMFALCTSTKTRLYSKSTNFLWRSSQNLLVYLEPQKSSSQAEKKPRTRRIHLGRWLRFELRSILKRAIMKPLSRSMRVVQTDESENAEGSGQDQDEELSLKATEPSKVCFISFWIL